MSCQSSDEPSSQCGARRSSDCWPHPASPSGLGVQVHSVWIHHASSVRGVSVPRWASYHSENPKKAWGAFSLVTSHTHVTWTSSGLHGTQLQPPLPLHSMEREELGEGCVVVFPLCI